MPLNNVPGREGSRPAWFDRLPDGSSVSMSFKKNKPKNQGGGTGGMPGSVPQPQIGGPNMGGRPMPTPGGGGGGRPTSPFFSGDPFGGGGAAASGPPMPPGAAGDPVSEGGRPSGSRPVQSASGHMISWAVGPTGETIPYYYNWITGQWVPLAGAFGEAGIPADYPLPPAPGTAPFTPQTPGAGSGSGY